DRAARRIANQAREITDQENRNVTEILKVLHLSDQDRVAHMNVGCGGIEAGFDPQGLACFLRALQFLRQFFFTNELDGAATDVVELLLDRDHFEVAHGLQITRRPSTSHLPDSTRSIASE